ncbi:hypothetical protein M3Y98_00024000 [Aphelenchoides besseyi]|nr:hypothetical protein M3Y98_00024000 [Aphelenchoides besseyi]KAI6199283.1 hypothetical protein M3Y96_00610500 [Aphelenchoides besseyi]
MFTQLAIGFYLLFGVVSAQVHSSRPSRPATRLHIQTNQAYNQEPSGYDGNNDKWPAALVIDTSNISTEAAAQHDLFYGGGGAAALPSRSFVEEGRARTKPVEERISTAATRRPTTTSTTTTPRPEFTSTDAEEQEMISVSDSNDYEGRRLPAVAAVRDPSHRIRVTTTPNPYEVNEEQQRLVTKLMNIDNLSRFTADDRDSQPNAYESNDRVTALLSRDREQPPSPFNNETIVDDTTDTNRTDEINEILKRPLNRSGDSPLRDENWERAALNIARLLHDESLNNQNNVKTEGSLKVGKKVRVIRLPPMKDAESEEIILVGEQGNATIHRGRGRTNMFIEATSILKRH